MSKEKPLPLPASYVPPPDPPEAKDPTARLEALETEQANVKSRLEALEKPKPVTP